MLWLIEKSVLDAVTLAENSGFTPTAAQHESFSALSGDISTVQGDIAKITISGVLTNTRNIMAMIFGGGNTTYKDIVEAVKSAEKDTDIASIDFLIDSPGGQIDGLFEAMDVIRTANKPTRSIIINRATSAAYGLAAQTSEIIALNRASSVGSIGIVTQGRVERDVVTITSTNAPFKRPDISTDTGRAIIRAELDEVEDLFVEAIAQGRDLKGETIVADFGKGMTFLAAEAMRRGMVDRIGLAPIMTMPKDIPLNVPNFTETISNRKAKAMNITELKAEHPALYDQVYALGKDNGLEAGTISERKRVNAHLKLGTRFSAMAISMNAIAEGLSTSDPEVNADYMLAMADARDLAANQSDSDGNDAGDNHEPEIETEAMKDQKAASNILNFAAVNLGIELSKGA